MSTLTQEEMQRLVAVSFKDALRVNDDEATANACADLCLDVAQALRTSVAPGSSLLSKMAFLAIVMESVLISRGKHDEFTECLRKHVESMEHYYVTGEVTA